MATNFAPAGVKFVAQGVDKFLGTFDKINKRIDGFNRNISSFATKANTTLTNSVDKIFSNIRGVDEENDPFRKMERQINSVTNKAIPALLTAITLATVAVGALLGKGLSVAVSFEDAFAGVTKTVDTFIDRTATAESGFITLTEAGESFRSSLLDLSQDIPVRFEKLADIAGLGGQLGIVEGLFGQDAEDALLSFTETVAGLAEATNLTQDTAATGLAQISNIYRQSVDDIGENVERLGATIVELGNTSATTESLILNFAQRIAGAGQTVGLTQAEVLGIGTAFASIGITAEAGSTAVNRALLIMNEAVANSSGVFADNTSAIMATQEEISDLQADLVRLEAQTGITGRSLTDQRDAFLEAGGAVEDFGRQLGDARREQLFQTQTAIDDLVDTLGVLRDTQGQAVSTEVFDELFRVIQNTTKGAELSVEAFQDLFKDDPAEAFALFVEGLAEEGERAGEVLDRIGLGSVEATRAFLAIAGASDTVRGQIESANLAFLNNSALVDEVSVRYATLKSRVAIFINSIRAAAFQIFNKIIPASIALVEEAQEIVKVFGDRIPAVIDNLIQRVFPALQALFDGLNLSGFDFIPTIVTSGFDALEGAINKIDIGKLIDQAIFFRDNVVPIIVGAFEFAVEHSDLFFGAIEGLIALLGGIALTSAITKAVTAIGWLSTPLGTVTLLAAGLGIAWETNFLNIQEVTKNVVSSVLGTLGELATKIGEFDFKGMFDNLFSGAEIETPEGDILSGDLIGVEDGLFDGIVKSAEMALETVGNLVSLVISTPIDQIAGIIDIFQGLVNVFDGLTANSLNFARTLDGIKLAISGFVDALTAPIRNLGELLGFDLDFQFLKDIGFNAAKQFIEGFLIGISGIDNVNIGNSLEEFISSLSELGESPGLQVFFAGLRQIWEGIQDLAPALINLSIAIKDLIGLEPDDSLIKFLGLLAGLTITIVADEVIAAIDALTGLVTILDGILSLDLEKVSTGLKGVGTALVDGFIAPLQRIGELSGVDLESKMEELATKATATFLEFWNEGLDRASLAFVEWLGGLGTAVTLANANFVLNAIVEIEEADQELAAWSQDLEDRLVLKFSVATLDLLATLTEIDNQLTTWIDEKSRELVLFLSIGTLDLLASLTEIDNQLTAWIDSVAMSLTGTLTGIWNDVDLGIPSFQAILDKAKGVKDAIIGFFTGIFDGISLALPDFDLGILSKLDELGIIDLDLEVEAPNVDGLGTDLADGIIKEVEEAEQSWQDAWTEFLLAPIESGKEALGIKSESTVTREMGQNVILGYASGLSDLTPIEEALMGLDSTILNAFQDFSTELLGKTIPTIQQTDRVFIALYSETLPRTTSALVDELIPAKQELAEVNVNEVVPSVDLLIEAQERLIRVLEDVVIKLDRVVGLKEKAKRRAKELVKEIDKLAESYLALASAIGSASEAGDGLTNTPSTGPVGPEFASGGSFIVPQGVGSEGMPIRVHSGELVQIIPREITNKLQSIPINIDPSSVQSAKVSGAPINNMINNSVNSTTTSQTKEYHLHLQEAPTSDIRDSFSLMEVLS